jgi:PAS domain S-box-containing protein
MYIGNRSNANAWRPEEAEEMLLAIRQGAVDAFVVENPDGDRVYTLEGADLPYSVLVERMQQGAAMLNAQCEIVYCNPSLADLIRVPRAALVGLPLQNYLDEADHKSCEELVQSARFGPTEGEMRLRRSDGTLIHASLSFQVLSRDTSTIGVLVTDLTAQKYHADLTARLQRMQDDERRRIARELHDSVGQLLVAVAMNIDRVKQESDRLSPETARLVQDNSFMIDQVSKEIRTISHLLHPPILDIAGLDSALRWYADGFAERSRIKVDVQIPEDFPRLRSDMEIAIFRMVQECLGNIRRHSGSESCAVTVRSSREQVLVEVRDAGCGIPESKLSTFPVSAGVGLRGLHERMQQLGGTLEIESNQAGTTVTAILPFAAEDADVQPKV